MKSLRTIACLTACLPMLLLSACVLNPVSTYQDTKQNSSDVQAQISTLRDRGYTRPSPSLSYNSSTAVLPPARWLSQPSWMNNNISMHGQNMPVSFWVNKIIGPTGAAISYQDGMNQNLTLPFDYTGTVRGALDKLADDTGYSYTVDGNNVEWSEFVTKTFDVSFMPGAAQYNMGGQTNIAGANSNSSGTNTGSTGGGTSGSTATSNQMQSGQSSSFQGNLSVWNDLQNTIKAMLSKDGQVIVSQSTTTITVRDKPENVNQIADYLASMNKDLSRQVALQVQVLQITLNKAFSYGIDWNLVNQSVSMQGGLTGTAPGQAVNTSLGGDLTSLGAIEPSQLGIGMYNGNPKIMINALAQQGQVSTVTNPRVMTLNNQVAQIAITTQKTYLASSSVTNTMNVGTQSALTPGVVTTGFTLYVLPKIMDHDVFLQLTSELSNLDSLTQFSSTTGQNANSSSNSSSSNQNNASFIEEPTVSSKSFNQRTMVPSGCTLVLAGYRQVANETNKYGPFGILPAGGMGAQQNTTEILVLITPVIVGDNG